VVLKAGGFVFGLLLLFQLPYLPHAGVVAAAVAVFFACSRLVSRFPFCTSQRIRSLQVTSFFVAAGFCYGWYHSAQIVVSYFPPAYLNQEILVEGTVVGAPQNDNRRLRFLLDLKRIGSIPVADSAQASPTAEPVFIQHTGRVRLNWYGDGTLQLRDGETLRLLVKLREPSGFMNPGGFDYERWLFQQRIVATGYVRQAELAAGDRITKKTAGVSLSHTTARAWLTSRVTKASQALDQQGLILALAVGDRSRIDQDQWQTFIATGTNHLLAISGLHIALVAGGAGLLIKLVWRVVWGTAWAPKPAGRRRHRAHWRSCSGHRPTAVNYTLDCRVKWTP